MSGTLYAHQQRGRTMRIANTHRYTGATMYRTFGRYNDRLSQTHREALPPALSLAVLQAQLEGTWHRMEGVR